MSDRTSAADLGVYIHVPFCERVCPYCDFAVEAVGARRALPPDLEAPWLDLLLREFEQVRTELASDLDDRRLRTVYLGGGTPSLLAPASIERILRALAGAFSGSPEEITLELNPCAVETERAAGFRAVGVNRLSVGLQSLQDRTLKRLGRGHTGDEARAGLGACLAQGFESISVDLIYGAPEQSCGKLLEDAAELLDMGLPHISAYALTIEPGTPFASAVESGKLALPSEDELLDQWLGLRSLLRASGLEQYEISSFARAGHRSRHNQRYWLRHDVLGLGPSAASLLGEHRFQNLRNRTVWQQALSSGASTRSEDSRLSEREARQETLGLGLRRLDGVSRAAYQRRFGAAPEAHFGAELRELRSLLLIEDRAGRICLTERGIRFADEVFLRFVGD